MALLFFWGLARVPMAQAITLTYVSPLLAMLLAAVFLHERVHSRVVVASVAAFAGVLVVMAGQASADLGHQAFLGALAVIASAVLYAGNLVVARVQSQAARPGEVAFFQSLIVAVLLALAAPWLAEWPDAAEWWKIILSAFLATGIAVPARLGLCAWRDGLSRHDRIHVVRVRRLLRLGDVRRDRLTMDARRCGGHRRGLPVRGTASRSRATCGRDCGMITIRAAAPTDVPTILRFVRELAAFEREPDAVVATEAMLHHALFVEQALPRH